MIPSDYDSKQFEFRLSFYKYSKLKIVNNKYIVQILTRKRVQMFAKNLYIGKIPYKIVNAPYNSYTDQIIEEKRNQILVY